MNNANIIKKEVGNRLKRMRVERDLSQQDLARKSGVSIHSISNIENGKDFTFDNLLSIMNAMNVNFSLDAILPYVAVNPYDISKGINNRQRKRRV